MVVVFIDTVHPILENRLRKAGFICEDIANLDRAESIRQISKADGIVIRSKFRLDEKTLREAPNLKFIARSGAGMENIDVQYCERNKIKLFNAPEGNRNAVGEHAIGMILSLFNKLHTADNEVRNGKWDREGNRGVELKGKTIGIIGYGNNGSSFARKLIGFDVEILAYDKYKTGFSNEHVVESSLADIFKSADVVSFHIPQNEETIYFANDQFFNSFAKPVYVINMSRGKIVQTSAIVNAMKTGKVLGACLDVLEYEKSSFENFIDGDSSDEFKFLLASKNVIFSPHVAGWTRESYYKLSDVLADKILSTFTPNS